MRRGALLGLGLVVGTLAATVPLNRTLEARAPTIQSAKENFLILPRAAVLRPLLLGFHPLAADLYWLRTVQYFGGRIESHEPLPQLYPLVDLATSLDPHFVEAYRLGGLFLDIAHQVPQAIAIYQKGIAANPDRWELPHDLGRLSYLELKDYPEALRWWLVANRLPGRPPYLSRFIARLYTKTGALETALELWQNMYEHASNEVVRQIAKREIEKVLAEMRGRTTPEAAK